MVVDRLLLAILSYLPYLVFSHVGAVNRSSSQFRPHSVVSVIIDPVRFFFLFGAFCAACFFSQMAFFFFVVEIYYICIIDRCYVVCLCPDERVPVCSSVALSDVLANFSSFCGV